MKNRCDARSADSDEPITLRTGGGSAANAATNSVPVRMSGIGTVRQRPNENYWSTSSWACRPIGPGSGCRARKRPLSGSSATSAGRRAGNGRVAVRRQTEGQTRLGRGRQDPGLRDHQAQRHGPARHSLRPRIRHARRKRYEDIPVPVRCTTRTTTRPMPPCRFAVSTLW